MKKTENLVLRKNRSNSPDKFSLYRLRQKKTDGFQSHMFLHIITFTAGLLCSSTHNMYRPTMPFAANISLLGNSVAMTTQINKYV